MSATDVGWVPPGGMHADKEAWPSLALACTVQLSWPSYSMQARRKRLQLLEQEILDMNTRSRSANRRAGLSAEQRERNRQQDRDRRASIIMYTYALVIF